MPIRTRRWNDPRDRDDGARLLVSRFRPRGLAEANETWDAWWKDLGPSARLHADFYGKTGKSVSWDEYRARYLAEMESQRERITQLAHRVANGEMITLLCSAACVDEARCHRSLLRGLIEEKMKELGHAQP